MKWVSNFDLSILVGFATIVYVGNRLFLIGMILLMFLIRINRIFGNVQKINPFIFEGYVLAGGPQSMKAEAEKDYVRKNPIGIL